MSRQWAIVRFSSADAADNAKTGSLSVRAPPGVTMELVLQPAADDIAGVPLDQHQHRHQQQHKEEEEEGEEEEQRGTLRTYIPPLDVIKFFVSV